MASTTDVLRGAIQSAAAGKELTSDNVDSSATPSGTSQATADSELEVRSENSTQEGLLDGSDDTPQDSSSTVSKEASSTKPNATSKTPELKEVITVTDESGRKRKIEIDYSNKEATKKAHLLAAGARKWQAERDQALQGGKQFQAELQEVKSNWNTLESAYKQGGVEGLVDLLEGRQGAFRDQVRRETEKQKFLENASPEELRTHEAQEASKKQARELESIRRENAEFKKQVETERETAELRSLESKIHPSFSKYRFADKLGDADGEHMFDEMLWNTALKQLEPYEEKGIDISPELIEKTFSTVARSIRNRIGAQAEKKATRVVEQKKQEATENVQAKLMSGYKSDGRAQEARDLINNGNLTGLLKGWNKYGSLFGQKK